MNSKYKHRAKIPPIEAIQYKAIGDQKEIEAFFGKEKDKLLFVESEEKIFIRTKLKEVPLISLAYGDYVVRDIAGNYHVESAEYLESRYEKDGD